MSRTETMSLLDSYAGARVLVTGGLGFIGSNLVLRLVELGADVRVVDALLPGHGGNVANLDKVPSSLRIDSVDQRDSDAMKRLIADRAIIFNLAGQVSHLDSMTDPRNDLEINTLAQVVLLEACRAVAPEATIIYASTRQIYGRPDYLPVDEKHPIRPVDVNGINKMAGEAYHTLYHQVYGMKTASLRLTNTYGPRMRIKDGRQTFLGLWLRRVLENECIEVWGGLQRRDLTFVSDVVEAFLVAGKTPALFGGAYNVGADVQLNLRTLAARLIELAGSGRYEQREFPPERKRIDIGDYIADDTLFRNLTGWFPKVDLDQGILRSLDYFRSRLALYL